MHLWAQWSDLSLPGECVLHSGPVSEAPLDEIVFYVPRYTGAALDLGAVGEMSKLQVLQLPNAGFEDALPYARPGLTICNARGVHDASTAELAVTLTLAALRGIPDFVRSQDRGEWSHERRSALADKKVAVIGFGSIGQRITRLFSALETEVVGYSRSGSNGSRAMTEFDAEIGQFDVIVLIAPATSETRHLINAKRLQAMKQGALLVNVARGSLVDTNALVDALNAGHVLAALDVTDPEPLPQGHALWQARNVLISPHVGGDTSAFAPRMRALVERQVERFLKGQELANIVSRG